jgi:hypothetical protein
MRTGTVRFLLIISYAFSITSCASWL